MDSGRQDYIILYIKQKRDVCNNVYLAGKIVYYWMSDRQDRVILDIREAKLINAEYLAGKFFVIQDIWQARLYVILDIWMGRLCNTGNLSDKAA